jgi:paraquat-inducible protein B
MAKQVSKTVIGGFVVSAIALLVIGVIVFGGGKFFKKTYESVIFFKGSVKGLKVGSPVDFRGVQIGSVAKIILKYNLDTQEVNIPVIVEIDPEAFNFEGKLDASREKRKERTQKLIEKGLRAQLTMESMVTGQLMVSLDFFPDTPVQLTGVDMGMPEIPTIPTQFEKLAETLEKVPIEEIFKKLLSAVKGVETVVNSPEVKDSIVNLKSATENLNRLVLKADGLVGRADKLVINVDNQVQPLSGGLQAAVGDARKLLQDVDSEVKPISGRAQEALVSARDALNKTEVTLAAIDGLVGQRSGVRDKLDNALVETADAARSLKELMDYLQRHPEALLQGKGSGSGGN